MPPPGWRTERSLADWLYAEPYGFDFFQAVRILERLRPDATALAEGSDPEREAVRFASTIRFDFPPSDMESVAPPATEDAPARMAVNFFGLAGGEGPLPQPLVELLQDRMRERDFGPRDFLDIFNHRLLALMFRGGRAHRPALTPRGPEDSAAGSYLRALAGFAQPGLRHRQAVPDQALLHYAGLLWQRPHSAAGLQRMLEDYFQLPFAVRQWRGRWQQLPPEEWTVLGAGGRNQALGVNTALGQRVWSQAGGCELDAGPLTLAQFLDLLPGGTALPALRDLARLYAGTTVEFTLCLILRADEVPPARLGAARLGRTAWLGGATPRTHPARVCVSLGASEDATEAA